jgi:hypothetical protein
MGFRMSLPQPRRSPFRLEPLEDRVLLASTAVILASLPVRPQAELLDLIAKARTSDHADRGDRTEHDNPKVEHSERHERALADVAGAFPTGPDHTAAPAPTWAPRSPLTGAFAGRGPLAPASLPQPPNRPILPPVLTSQAPLAVAIAEAPAHDPEAQQRLHEALTGASEPGSVPLAAVEPSAPPEPASPLAGMLPFDLTRLERGADAFFERLAQLGEDWETSPLSAKLAPWLVAAMAVACEIVRRRNTRSVAEPGPGPLPFCMRDEA